MIKIDDHTKVKNIIPFAKQVIGMDINEIYDKLSDDSFFDQIINAIDIFRIMYPFGIEIVKEYDQDKLDEIIKTRKEYIAKVDNIMDYCYKQKDGIIHYELINNKLIGYLHAINIQRIKK